MLTMKKLEEKFNRNYPDYHAELKDRGVTVPTLYRVDIGLKGQKPTSFYFMTCKEFDDFIRNFSYNYALIMG